jgi:hypothetical protein
VLNKKGHEELVGIGGWPPISTYINFFLGLDISQYASSIKLWQAKYARYLLEIFHMTDCKSTPTPFLSVVKLEDGGDTPLVENTLYK